jgi:hypothetical protein
VKTLLTYLALVGFTTVSVVSVGRAVRSELKRGPAFDSAALGAWLVAPSDDDVNRITLRRAARRLEQEFHDYFDRRTEYQALDESTRRTYEANWQRLLVTLVRQHADAFAATPKHRREAFLNQRIKQFNGWYVFDDGRRVSAFEYLQRPGAARDAAAMFVDPVERERIRGYATAMQEFASNKFWGRILPGGTTKRPEREDD